MSSAITVYLLHEYMRNSNLRYQSFRNCYFTPYFYSYIENGFYYEGQGKCAVCFSCGLRIELVEIFEFEIELYHSRNSPDCKFLLQEDFSFPTTIPKIRSKFSVDDDDKYKTKNDGKISMVQYKKKQQIPRDFTPVKSYFRVGAHFVPFQNDTLSLDIDALFIEMRQEKNRFYSFFTYEVWDEFNTNPKYISECGFFYCQSETYIQCAFCRLVLYDLKSNDNIKLIHTLKSPNCVFLKSYNWRNNVPFSLQYCSCVENVQCGICEKKIQQSRNAGIVLNEMAISKDLIKCKRCFKNDAVGSLIPCKHYGYCQQCYIEANRKKDVCILCGEMIVGLVLLDPKI